MKVRSIRDIAAAARGRRRSLGLNQGELAGRAGVSRKWISEFEAGKSTAELGLVLRVLRELGFELDLSGLSAKKPSDTPGPIDLDELLDNYRSDQGTNTGDG